VLALWVPGQLLDLGQAQELERLVLPGQVLPLGLPALLQPLVLQLGQPLFWQLLVAWRLLMRPRAPESLDRFPEPRGME
jgi:hypothetical protein